MLTSRDGALAQLGARLNGIQKAVGSNPICSIKNLRINISKVNVSQARSLST